jgi:hypothetical protein
METKARAESYVTRHFSWEEDEVSTDAENNVYWSK